MILPTVKLFVAFEKTGLSLLYIICWGRFMQPFFGPLVPVMHEQSSSTLISYWLFTKKIQQDCD